MREIKFRAWHKSWGLMANEIGIGDIEANIIVGNTGDTLDIPEEYSNLVFMQYTGLKDMNGNEIYEGDIAHNGGVVVFGDGCFLLKTAGDLDMLVRYRMEVIGNIYENPELLEGECNG